MGNQVEFGIKLTYDGKDVSGGLSVNREDFRRMAADVKNAGRDMAGGTTAAAEGVRSISTQLAAMGQQVSVIGSVGAAMAATAGSVAGLTAATRALVDTQLQYEKSARLLQFATGSAQAAGESYRFIAGQANALGLELNATAAAFGKFSAATKGTALEGEKTRDIFIGVSKAASTLSLSSEETSGAFLALTQMIGKGVVSAEEFRGQLAERIPVATQAAADALGVTTAQFSKMLESGEIVAAEFLPLFARRLEELASAGGLSADSLQNDLNRMGNAWTQLKQTVNEAGVATLIQTEVNGLTALMQGIRGEIEGTDRTLRNFLANAALIAAGNFFPPAGVLGRYRMENPAPGQTSIGAQRESSGKIGGLQQEAAAVKDLSGAWESYGKVLDGFAGKDEKRLADREKVVAAYARMMAAAKGNADAQAEATRQMQHALENIDAKAANGGAADKLAKGYESAARKADDFLAALGRQDAAIGLSAGQQKMLEAATIALTLKTDAQKSAFLASAAAAAAEIDAKHDAEAATKAHAKAIEDASKAMNAGITDAWKSVEATEKETEKLREQLETVGLSAEALAQYRQGKLDAAAATELATAASLDATAALMEEQAEYGPLTDEMQTAIRYYRELAAAKRAAANAQTTQGRIEAELTVAAAASKEWKQTADNIERSLTDALMRSFESGKGFGETFRDTLVNLFRTLVLRPVIQGVVQSGMNAVGLSGLTGAVGAAGNSSNSLSSLYSAGNSLYNFYNGEGPIYGALQGAYNWGGELTGLWNTTTYTANVASMNALAAAELEAIEAATILNNGVALTAAETAEVIAGVEAGAGSGAAAAGLAAYATPIGWALAVGMALNWFSGLGGSAKINATALAGLGENGALLTPASLALASGATLEATGTTPLARPLPQVNTGEVTGVVAPNAAASMGWPEYQAAHPGAEVSEWVEATAAASAGQFTPLTSEGLLANNAQLTAAVQSEVEAPLATHLQGLIKAALPRFGDLVKRLGGNGVEGLIYGLRASLDPGGDAPDNFTSSLHWRDAAGQQHDWSATNDGERGKTAQSLVLEIQRLSIASIMAAEGIPKVFKSIVEGSDLATASAEQMAAIMDHLGDAKTVLDYTELDPFAEWAAAQSSNADTLMGAYEAQGKAVRELLKDFDGSAASTRALAAGVRTLAQAEAALVNQIEQGKTAWSSAIAGFREQIVYNTLGSAPAQHEYLRNKALGLEEQIASATSPEVVARLTRELLTTNQSAFQIQQSRWGELSEAERAQVLNAYLGTPGEDGVRHGGTLAQAETLGVNAYNRLGNSITSVHEMSDPDSLGSQLAAALDGMPASAAAASVALDTISADAKSIGAKLDTIAANTAALADSGTTADGKVLDPAPLRNFSASADTLPARIQSAIDAAMSIAAQALAATMSRPIPVDVSSHVSVSVSAPPGSEVSVL